MPNHALNDTNRSGINVYLQSDNATTSLGESHKVFQFQNGIKVPPDQDILVSLTNFSMANTLYNINLGFNEIVINGETLTIPPANYSAFQLYEKLNDLFDGNANLSSVGTAVSFDNQTFKFTFTANSNINITSCGFSFELGLENQLPTGNFTTYTAIDTCMLGGLDTLYIGCPNLGIKNLDSRGEIDNTIGSINIQTNSSYFIYYDKPEYHYFLSSTREVNTIEIKLTDHKDRLLQLNGGQFNLVLTFLYIYKREDKVIGQYYLEPPKIDDPKVNESEKTEKKKK